MIAVVIVLAALLSAWLLWEWWTDGLLPQPDQPAVRPPLPLPTPQQAQRKQLRADDESPRRKAA